MHLRAIELLGFKSFPDKTRIEFAQGITALIGLILVGYSIFTKPAREAQMAERRRQDSIARVEQIRALEQSQQQPVQEAVEETGEQQQDSASLERLSTTLGDFASSAVGTEERVVLENEELEPRPGISTIRSNLLQRGNGRWKALNGPRISSITILFIS